MNRNTERDNEIRMDREHGGMSLRKIADKHKISLGRVSQICKPLRVAKQMELPLVSNEKDGATDSGSV